MVTQVKILFKSIQTNPKSKLHPWPISSEVFSPENCDRGTYKIKNDWQKGLENMVLSDQRVVLHVQIPRLDPWSHRGSLDSTKSRHNKNNFFKDQRDRTAGTVLALHTADPHSIPGVPYNHLNTFRNNPEHFWV